MSTPTPAAPRPKRRLPRILLGVLLVCLLLFAGYYVHGTWAAATPRDPDTVQQGVVCQLVKGEDGGTDIRTSILIPVPVETAWRILSNYEEWERLFKTIRKKQVAEKLNENQHHVVSDVLTPLGTISLDFVVTHEKTEDGGYRAWWDAPTRELPVNHGTIRLEPKGSDRTLLVYTIRKQYRQYPQFLVNNMLLRQQPDLVRTLARRMVEIAQES